MQNKRNVNKILIITAFLSFGTIAKKLPYPQVLNQINQHLLNKDYIQAYEFADNYTFDLGGEAEFDLLLGFAAYGNEKYQEAVFAFERVVLNKPKSFLGRFYLAQSYNKVENLAAAVTELEKLQATTLTGEQREKTNGLKTLINRKMVNRKRTWYQMVALNMAFDNNINSATSEDSVVAPGITPEGAEDGVIVLSDASKETEDNSYGVSYLAGYQHPINQYQWFKFDFSASHFGYEEHNEFQRQQLGISIAYEQELLRGQMSLSAFSRPLWLEQDVKTDTVADIAGEVEREVALYRTENGAAFSFQKSTSRKHGYRLGLNYSQISNDVNPNLDLTRGKVSFAYQYKTKLLHTIMLHWQRDMSEIEEYEYNDKDTTGITYQITWPITSNFISNSFIMVERHDYKAAHPIFSETRDEILGSVSSQLIYKLNDNHQLKLQVNAQKKDSNLPLFTYERFEVGGGWQYRF